VFPAHPLSFTMPCCATLCPQGAADADDSSDSDSDDGMDEDMPEAVPVAAAAATAPPQPVLDADGFELVQKRRGRR
jgi:pre-rRNA-processing protein TSR2